MTTSAPEARVDVRRRTALQVHTVLHVPLDNLHKPIAIGLSTVRHGMMGL